MRKEIWILPKRVMINNNNQTKNKRTERMICKCGDEKSKWREKKIIIKIKKKNFKIRKEGMNERKIE